MTLHIVFVVGATDYALPVGSVLMMESFNGATPVPGVAPFVVGIVTVRGRVVPVIDLRLRFGLPAAETTLDTRIVVAQHGARVVALRVDSAREVVQLDPEKNQPAPSVVAERSAGFVSAVHALGSRLLLLVDLPKILGEESHDHESPALAAGSPQRPALPG